MSRATREQVFSALFAQLQSLQGLVTCSRILQNVQDMQPETLPAAFQLQGKQTTVYRGDVPTRTELSATWAIYAGTVDGVPPTTPLNALVDAACAAIAPTGALKQQLGGIVEYAAIDGDIQIFEGILGNRAVALVPIKLILAGF